MNDDSWIQMLVSAGGTFRTRFTPVWVRPSSVVAVEDEGHKRIVYLKEWKFETQETLDAIFTLIGSNNSGN